MTSRLETSERPSGEPKKETFSHDSFVARLYDGLSKGATDNAEQKIFEIPPQKVRDWVHHDEDLEPRTNPLPNNIIGGFILRTNGRDLVVALGERQRSKWSTPTLSLQFGTEPNGGIDENIENPLQAAKDILNKKSPKISGEFFVDPEKGVVFIFHSRGENPEVEAIKLLSQEELLTRAGLELSIKMIQSFSKKGAHEDIGS